MSRDVSQKNQDSSEPPEAVLETLPVRRACVLKREYRKRVSELLRDCKYQVNSVAFLYPEVGPPTCGLQASAPRCYHRCPVSSRRTHGPQNGDIPQAAGTRRADDSWRRQFASACLPFGGRRRALHCARAGFAYFR